MRPAIVDTGPLVAFLDRAESWVIKQVKELDAPLLDAMVRHGVDTIVFSSSCATYGVPDVLPIVEDAPQQPISPYGHSKLMCEQILKNLATARNFRVALLRYFNACGADPEGQLSERHDPETHLIPLAIDAASGRGPPLQIFGADYPTADGTCGRDFIHVSDLAGAHVAALNRPITALRRWL
jgi:UDP-arabinose 4-epimerase